MFDLDGNNRWASGQADFSEISYDYWIENIAETPSTGDYTKLTCKKYPRMYITVPTMLTKFDIVDNTDAVIVTTASTAC